MNKYLQILVGLIFLVAPIYAWIVDWAGFGTAALALLKGGIVWIFLMIGIAFLATGFSELRD
jgi:hypothetical protein